MSDILDKLWLKRHPKDALFLSIIEGYTIQKSKEYPNYIYYMKGEHLLIYYNNKTKNAYINNELIWSIFESKFYLNFNEIRNLMSDMSESYLNLKGITPYKDI